MLHAMIMAGGGGTRFWPRSRVKKPKQFLTFSGDRTLLQSTIDRTESQVPTDRVWILTSAAHRAEAIHQLPELDENHVVGEPMGRDTAPCIALGAALIAKEHPAGIIIVMPADHLIEPVQEFRRAVHAAEQLALDHPEALITFGIPPTYPAVGYGYIQRGASAGQKQNVPVYEVKQFREKPNFDDAQKYIASGEFYWNSGIFVWKVSAILGELKRQKPEMLEVVQKIADAWGTADQEHVFRQEYPKAEKISIDYAVMEKAKQVLVLQAPYQWDDVGSWLALERRNPQDAQGNTIQANHVGIDTSNCVIAGDSERLIATIGVSNLLIIQDGDATLIADRKDEAAVKQIVDRLKAPGLDKFL
ncbi:mannose-1-phosphate guanylyltransferase [Telmatocola sphagniphila]|uniref:mannose-1-phosphate guanylyltransferase n=1 Tax=Telmatocola sphagniphila TaxID=1123043 RepID=A0A8E6ETC8_9BACT|nr:mannose-1-phosphate guanylyltransferase [Telmatocola sphagniphila]QVL32284.1 mannose-1-phosphate guanylyltransferase [Telmatocola sphagniphila]